jgi:putative ABC transport system permease protein
MKLLSDVFARLRSLLFRRREERELAEELRLHADMEAAHQRGRGLSDAEARRRSLVALGGIESVKERVRDARGTRLWEDSVADAAYALRTLKRSPGFATVVILTLALGIGGNTAVFSVVDQLLLRPLPYPNGDRLVIVEESVGRNAHADVSPANWLDWQRGSRALRGLAAWNSMAFRLTGAGEPKRVSAQLVSAEFFPVLGVAPLLGRTISDEDDRLNGPRVAVVSYRAWQEHFGGDPRVIGRRVQLSDRPYEIVGVMPAGFQFVQQDIDFWTALQLDRNRRWRENEGRFIHVVGRLEASATVGMARSEMETIARRLAATYPFNTNTSVTVTPLREVLTGQVEDAVLVLFAGVAVLLAIACFNVASMLLARSASRHREMAIRVSLGAGRWAIARSLLIEGVLLAIAGGALGVALARGSLDAFLAVAPVNLLGVSDLFIDGRVLAYAFVLSLATGAIAGLAPALLFARRSTADALRTRSAKAGDGPRVRQALVIAQVAMTVVLLCGAGVLVRTLMALDRVSPGFDVHDVLTLKVSISPARYPGDRSTLFFSEALARLRAMPGVDAAAAATSLPVIGSPRAGTSFHLLGSPERAANERPTTLVRIVTPGFFGALRVPVLQGHEFPDNATPATGFVVNETFARTYLAGRDPLATSIAVWIEADTLHQEEHLPIIGVLGDVSEGSLRNAPRPTVFYSNARLPQASLTVFVRTRQVESVAPSIAAALHESDPMLVVSNVGTLETALGESLARERVSALIAASFGIGGLLLASLGLYGLLAYLVTERTKDIGIRIALGAPSARVKRSVVAGGLALAGIGTAIGTVGSLLLLRWLRALLFGVTPYDVWTYTVVVALLAVIAAAASYLPARRAARIEPLVALRQE